MRKLRKFAQEVGNPIQVIMVYSAMLQKTRLIPSQLEMLTEILESAIRVKNISIQALSKEGLNIEIFCLFEEMGRILNFLLPYVKRKEVSITNNIPESTPYVVGDRVKINQVVTNLIINAVNFTPKGGTVTLTIACQDENLVSFQVKDTGVGIPSKYHGMIFEPYFRGNGKYKGIGIGLPISKQLVEMMGGQIWMESEEDKGSTFTFTLPTKL